MEQTVFELDLLEEARDFLKSLSKEIRGKSIYFENKNKKI